MGLFSKLFRKNEVLTISDSELISNYNIDSEVVTYIRREIKGEIEQLKGFTEVGDEYGVKGISILVKGDIYELLRRHREYLSSKGFIIFWNERNFGYSTDSIGILKTSDKYEVLKLKHTNGYNYDIDNDQVIKKLKEWELRYSFKLIGADFDWVEIEFDNEVKDIQRFVGEVYEFCPDSVNQGAESVGTLAQEILDSRKLHLWWD